MNFNVNFNVLLSKHVVNRLVKIKDFDNVKMHSTTMKKNLLPLSSGLGTLTGKVYEGWPESIQPF